MNALSWKTWFRVCQGSITLDQGGGIRKTRRHAHKETKSMLRYWNKKSPAGYAKRTLNRGNEWTIEKQKPPWDLVMASCPE